MAYEENRMETALWGIQILLAVVFSITGYLKVSQPKEKLAKQVRWVRRFPPSSIKAFGVAELLATAGLILPMLTGILPWLTPLAATGLVLDMIVAALVHLRLSEYNFIALNVVLGVLAAFVAVGRFFIEAV